MIVLLLAEFFLGLAIVVLSLYAVRHYIFAFCRLALRRPRDFMELTGFAPPRTSVLVPMHNEEAVAADVLQALVECDYDRTRLEIIAINDGSEDGTGRIIDDYAARFSIVKAIHRERGAGGKAAALQDATRQATGDVLLLFDADYFPGPSMVKQLVAPFCDPQVGAVMGRVVPHNTDKTMLAALLGLERAAGYQVGQQARYNLGLTPQFGGTVGGVRRTALESVEGWNTESLTEDTDLTFRLVLHGWKVAYVNRAECYEEVPELWPARERQIARWATGHTDCLHRLLPALVRSRSLSFVEKTDAIFVLACYLTAPVLILGWLASLVLFFTPEMHSVPVLSVALMFVGYQIFGNQATFFELGIAAMLDGVTRRVLLMPCNLFNFFASTSAISKALLGFYVGKAWGSGGGPWYKTSRFRKDGKDRPFVNGSSTGPKLFSQGPNGLYTYSRSGD